VSGGGEGAVGSSAINAGRPINVTKTEASNLVCNLMVATITNTELSRFRSLALFWRSLAMNRERRHPAGDWKAETNTCGQPYPRENTI
jgi:hypothetical protein